MATVRDAWQTHAVPAARHRHATIPKPWAGNVRARVKEYGIDAVIRMIDWWWQAPDAAFLREGGYELDTLIRASKAPKYIELAANWSGPAPPPMAEFVEDDAAKAARAARIKASIATNQAMLAKHRTPD